MSTKVYMGGGGPKSPKTCLRSLWMAPNVNTYSPVRSCQWVCKVEHF